MEKNRILRNINGLTAGRRTNCGEYGIVTCTRSAAENGRRTFKVNGSTRIANRGNWDMNQFRKAICG